MNIYVKRYNPNGLSILGLSKFYLTVYYHGSYLTRSMVESFYVIIYEGEEELRDSIQCLKPLMQFYPK
jgi:hypothetical protein